MDDYVKHLVLLGGVDWNRLTCDVLLQANLLVRQRDRSATNGISYFEVTDDEPRRFAPLIADGVLLEDVAHFFHGRNPFNRSTTVTICNGIFGRGTYSVVRALTDQRFRDRNHQYICDQLGDHDTISMLMRVQVVHGQVLTPDWTDEATRLHQWLAATE